MNLVKFIVIKKVKKSIIFLSALVIYCLEMLEIFKLLDPTLLLYLIKGSLFISLAIFFYLFERGK